MFKLFYSLFHKKNIIATCPNCKYKMEIKAQSLKENFVPIICPKCKTAMEISPNYIKF